jgi:transcriptional regulator with XRE-family HTH domain
MNDRDITNGLPELSFGAAAKQLRLERGMTLREMAKLMKCTAGFVRKMEMDSVKIPNRFIDTYARLGVHSEHSVDFVRLAMFSNGTISLRELPCRQQKVIVSIATTALPRLVIESLERMLQEHYFIN